MFVFIFIYFTRWRKRKRKGWSLSHYRCATVCGAAAKIPSAPRPSRNLYNCAAWETPRSRQGRDGSHDISVTHIDFRCTGGLRGTHKDVPKLPKKCKKKDKIFGSNVEISEVSHKNSAAAEMSNR
jgi:hypothetical protein